MIDNAKERAALAISELQQGGEEFERAKRIIDEATEKCSRMAALILTFPSILDRAHESTSKLKESIMEVTELEAMAISDLASVGISTKYPESGSVMEPVGAMGFAMLMGMANLMRFKTDAVAGDDHHGHILSGASEVGVDICNAGLSLGGDMLNDIKGAELSAQAFRDIL